MTTGPGAVRGWNEQTDTEKSRAGTVYKSLGQAGLVDQSGKGGGKSAVELDAVHLVRLAVGIATAEPANAADKTTLEFMELGRHTGLSSLIPPLDVLGVCKATVGETLISLTERIAEDPAYAKVLHSVRFELTFELGRPGASVIYRILSETNSLHFSSYVMGENSERYKYYPSIRSTVRKASINSYQIEMLAEFLRDTWEKKGRLLPQASSSSNSVNNLPDDASGSKNDDGANLAGKAPPTRNQSRRKKASPGLNNREANAKRDFCHVSRGGESDQSPIGDSTFTTSRSFLDDANKRYSAAAASPCS